MSEEGLFVCGENSQKMVDKDHCQKGNSPEPKIRSLNFRVTILRCVSGDNIKLYAVVFTKWNKDSHSNSPQLMGGLDSDVFTSEIFKYNHEVGLEAAIF